MARFTLEEPLDVYLGRSYVALTNARNDAEISRRLTRFGYDTARLDEGLALRERLYGLHQRQVIEYGEQYEATQVLYQTWEEMKVVYGDLRGMARIYFGDDVLLYTALLLNEPRRQVLYRWLEQAQMFFSVVLGRPEVLAVFERRLGMPRAEFVALQNRVQEIADLDTLQELEKRDAQRATRERNEVFEEFHAYMKELKAVAEMALRDQQDLDALLWGPVP